jgi:hypothetical protein
VLRERACVAELVDSTGDFAEVDQDEGLLSGGVREEHGRARGLWRSRGGSRLG